MTVTPQEEHVRNLREDALRAHDAESEFWTQVNQGALDGGTLAIKTAFLINGGAALAVLGFIGAVAGQGRIGDADVQNITSALMWFTSGVALAGFSTGAAYFTNLATAAMSSSKKRLWEHPYLGPPDRCYTMLRTLFLAVAVIAGIGSMCLFVGGMIDVKHSVSKMKLVVPSAQKAANATTRTRGALARRPHFIL
ncbi:hypothetical protein [Pseudolabrys sp. FHR47]|uniref:hypothetical protein n=1 Tax=Pseudolabrys sp. FHR47 TaxID=2562284 RepID=UPI0010BE60D9|nr:hypothetical protein [Pseudolabrys sp. FHR47]